MGMMCRVKSGTSLKATSGGTKSDDFIEEKGCQLTRLFEDRTTDDAVLRTDEIALEDLPEEPNMVI